VLVKYNSSGIAQWARTVQTAHGAGSVFYGVAIDNSGNVYAAGQQNGTSPLTYTYGDGVTVTGTSTAENVVLVKYNPEGVAQWARSVQAGTTIRSLFHSVAVDSTGNVYAAGYQVGTGTYTYGDGVTAQGTSSNGNAVLVKYNYGGVAQWVQSVLSASANSEFSTVAVDSVGNVYAAGCQVGTGTYTYGNGVTAQGTSDGNAVLVKYNYGGVAQWAQSVTGTNISSFLAVAADSIGNVYAAGFQVGTGTYTYGTGVAAQGTYSDRNVVLTKYNSSGVAQWAQSVAGTNDSYFLAVATDISGNVYAAGRQNGAGAYTYGTGVFSQGTYSAGSNAVLVKYHK